MGILTEISRILVSTLKKLHHILENESINYSILLSITQNTHLLAQHFQLIVVSLPQMQPDYKFSMKEFFTNNFSGALLEFYASYCIVLLNTDYYSPLRSQGIRQQMLFERLRSYRCTACIGYPGIPLESMRRDFLLASRFLSAYKGDGTLYYLEDYPEFALQYFAGQEYASLQKAFPNLFEKLKLYDQQNHTDHAHTLSVYIGSGLNARKASRDLFIHSNTMLYRLSRIEEILGVDFSSPNSLFLLLFSYRLNQYEYTALTLL